MFIKVTVVKDGEEGETPTLINTDEILNIELREVEKDKFRVWITYKEIDPEDELHWGDWVTDSMQKIAEQLIALGIYKSIKIS